MKKIILYLSIFISLVTLFVSGCFCDCKLTRISHCFCNRPTPDSLSLSKNKAIPFRKDETCVTISKSNSYHYGGGPTPLGSCGFYIATEKIKQKSVEYKKRLTFKIPGVYKFVNTQAGPTTCVILLCKLTDAKFDIFELIRDGQPLSQERASIEDVVEIKLSKEQVSIEDVVEIELSIPAAKTDNDSAVIANIVIKTPVFYFYSSTLCNVIH